MTTYTGINNIKTFKTFWITVIGKHTVTSASNNRPTFVNGKHHFPYFTSLETHHSVDYTTPYSAALDLAYLTPLVLKLPEMLCEVLDFRIRLTACLLHCSLI